MTWLNNFRQLKYKNKELLLCIFCNSFFFHLGLLCDYYVNKVQLHSLKFSIFIPTNL